MVDRPWMAHRSSASGHSGARVAGEGAGEVEEAAASTFVCSSELGRRGIGGTTEVKNRRRSGSVGARSSAGEEEERVW